MFWKNTSITFSDTLLATEDLREDCTALTALIHDMNNVTTVKCTSERFMEMEYLRQRYLAEKTQDCLEQRNILLK